MRTKTRNPKFRTRNTPGQTKRETEAEARFERDTKRARR